MTPNARFTRKPLQPSKYDRGGSVRRWIRVVCLFVCFLSPLFLLLLCAARILCPCSCCWRIRHRARCFASPTPPQPPFSASSVAVLMFFLARRGWTHCSNGARRVLSCLQAPSFQSQEIQLREWTGQSRRPTRPPSWGSGRRRPSDQGILRHRLALRRSSSYTLILQWWVPQPGV
ncbi:hypothetical protein GGTG_13954 [Gaeumannomyces tritici R3-111a-1]|uniref:Uncharacterized protein n=1 Tax=Gaeumannomyces tritici (strain R3-111a-1) TaxID=644352 RepID=J3PKA4_GAET3|nr:hypothetical protein GGTG_13954 [Gaeumannomyces tritici R3-111a-1]EJT68470.1 hypothetical protein GGTG_13954 [Gaeumannomyces tritici R3-111a-1]